MKTRLGWMLAIAALVGCSGTKSEQEPAAGEAAAASTTLAVVPYGDGKIMFIDEGRVIPGAGISFVEIGDVDISDLLETQHATALEVFLALAPKGEAPPQRLVEHHRETALANVTVPLEPRLLKIDDVKLRPSALEPTETSKSACWGWGGVNTFDPNIGNDQFTYDLFKTAARSWSAFTGLVSSKEMTIHATGGSLGFGETKLSTQRSLAVCLTQAHLDMQGDLERSCKLGDNHNQVFVRVRITTNGGVTAAEFNLEGFGTGGRFRSSLVNSGGQPRIYEATVDKLATPNESGPDVDHCLDEVHGVWHWKLTLPPQDPDLPKAPPPKKDAGPPM